MKVLITGVAGFIGSNLANSLLKNNIQVVGVDNLSYGVLGQVPKDVEFHKMDIRDKNISDIFDNIDYVFHLAAKNCITDCQEDPMTTFDINVNGTINIFEAAIKKNIKKVIYAESSSVYEGATSLPSNESEVFPESIYAISKITTNFLAKDYRKSKGLVTTGLRYFNVYGPRQDYRRTIPPVFSAFIINLLKGKQPTIFGDGSKKRDFVYVDDVNNFHLMCIQDDRTDNEVFNIGSGKNYSINEIYNEIKNLLQSDIEPLFSENFSFEAQNNLANINKAKDIGWNVKIDLKTGLKKSIDYIKENVISSS
jgi:nucleoside-diphosphate-sugar epimerase